MEDHKNGPKLGMTLKLKKGFPTFPLDKLWMLPYILRGCYWPQPLCYQLIKWRTHSLNPVRQRFDIFVYSKQFFDGTPNSICGLDADTVLSEQIFHVWPEENVEVNLSGNGLTAIKNSRYSFQAPVPGKDFQRVFPVYFDKSTDFDNFVSMWLSISSTTTEEKPQMTNFHFDWDAKQKIPHTNIRIKRGIGLQNNYNPPLQHKGTCPDFFEDYETVSPDGSTSPSTNSTTNSEEDAEIVYVTHDALGLKITQECSTKDQKRLTYTDTTFEKALRETPTTDKDLRVQNESPEHRGNALIILTAESLQLDQKTATKDEEPSKINDTTTKKTLHKTMNKDVLPNATDDTHQLTSQKKTAADTTPFEDVLEAAQENAVISEIASHESPIKNILQDAVKNDEDEISGQNETITDDDGTETPFTENAIMEDGWCCPENE